jgi:hypothetical protein
MSPALGDRECFVGTEVKRFFQRPGVSALTFVAAAEMRG